MKEVWRRIAATLLSVFFVQCASAAIIPIRFDTGTVGDVTTIVYALTFGVAAVMFVLHMFKWITADDDQGRFEARNNVIYVFVALIILVLAGILVGMFYSPPTGY